MNLATAISPSNLQAAAGRRDISFIQSRPRQTRSTFSRFTELDLTLTSGRFRKKLVPELFAGRKMGDGSHRETLPAEYDHKRDIKAFDDSKAGVKGILDAGITKLPPMFVHDVKYGLEPKSQFTIPIIDFQGLASGDAAQRGEIIQKLKDACEEWGFLQIVNHGLPEKVLNQMVEGIRKFHEQDAEVKKQYYTREMSKVAYTTNFDLYQAKKASWRDSIYFVVAPDPPEPEELPEVFRDILFDYAKVMKEFGHTLFELLSEGLGLKPNHLLSIGCADGLFINGHYYPPCPEPELTIGQNNHTDTGFLTVLLQDKIGGLQILHENEWVDVPCLPGVIVVNIADLLQLVTNDRFKSINHRVLCKSVGPRISIANFFRVHFDQEASSTRMYGPIEELISEENPAIYRKTTVKEFVSHRFRKGADGISILTDYKLNN